MGTSFVPSNINGGFNTNASLNTNFTNIQTALGRCLNVHGDSDTGGNAMQVDLDMNSNTILNLPAPSADTNPMTKAYADANYGGSAAAAAAVSAAAASASETAAASSETNAATSETNAATSETNAATSEANAATYETLAFEWAQKTTGLVAATDYSAKEFAQGSYAGTGGSSKNWAQQTGSAVTGAGANDYSAKSWAQAVLTGATLGGSARDWAVTAEDTLVNATEYSAYHWAQKAALASGGDTAKVSSNDTTVGYLNGKLVAGVGVTFTENNDGGNETLSIAQDRNFAVKTAATSRTATTVSADPDLAVTLEEGKRYIVKCKLWFSNGDDPKLGVYSNGAIGANAISLDVVTYSGSASNPYWWFLNNDPTGGSNFYLTNASYAGVKTGSYMVDIEVVVIGGVGGSSLEIHWATRTGTQLYLQESSFISAECVG